MLCILKDGSRLPYRDAADQKRLGDTVEIIFTDLTKDSFRKEFDLVDPRNFSSLKKITIKDSYIYGYVFPPIPSLEVVEFTNATINAILLEDLIQDNPQLKQIKRTNTQYDSFSLLNLKPIIALIEQYIQRINEFSGETDLPDDSPPESEYDAEDGSLSDYDYDEDYQESEFGVDDEEEVSSQGTDNSEEVHVKISTVKPAKDNPKKETQSVASSTATVNRTRAAVNKVLPTRSRTTSDASDLASEDGDAEFTVTKDYALQSKNVEGSMLGDEVDLYSNPDQMPDIDSARQRYTPPSTIQIRCRLADDSEDDVMTDYSALDENDYVNIVEMHIIGNGSLNTNILTLTEIDFSTLTNLKVLSVANASIASDSELDVSEIVLSKLREVHIGSGCAVNAVGIEVFTVNSDLESISFEPGTKRAESADGYIVACDNFEATEEGLADLARINSLIGEAGKLSGGYSDDLFEDFDPEPAKKSSTTTPIKQSISCRLQGDHPGQDVHDYTKLTVEQRKKITSLMITGAPDVYPNVINDINWSELDHLQHLDLVDVSLSGNFPATRFDRRLLPNLQTVEFTRCGLDINTLNQLVAASGPRLSSFTIEDCFDVNKGMGAELDSEALKHIQQEIRLFRTSGFRSEPTDMSRTRTFSAGSSEFDLDILQGEEFKAPKGVTILCRKQGGDENIFFEYGILTAEGLREVVEIKIEGTSTNTNILTAGIKWSNFPNLSTLTVSNASIAAFDGDMFDDEDEPVLPNLIELNFGNNTAVNEAGIRAFLTMAPELSTIEWGDAVWAADKGRDGRIIVEGFSDSEQGEAESEKLTALGLELRGQVGAMRKSPQTRVVNSDRKSEQFDEDDFFEEGNRGTPSNRPAKAGLGGVPLRDSVDNNRPTIYYALQGSDWIEYLGTETEALKRRITHLWIRGSDRTRELNRDINLKDFKNLEHLTISGATITDDGFEDEEVLPHLQTLEIRECNVDYETLLSFSDASSNLTHLQTAEILNSKGVPFTLNESAKIATRSEIAERRGNAALIGNMVQHRQKHGTAASRKVEQENEPLSGQKQRQSSSSTSRHALFGQATSRRLLSSTASNTAKHTTQYRRAIVDSTYHTEREELRTVDDIRKRFVEGLQEIDTKRQDVNLEPLHMKYSVTIESQDNCVRLNYNPDPSSVEPIKVLEVDASTDTTTVYKNWSTQVDPGNKHISLEEKALIVLHSLGIPPCPPDIKISNETSKLAQEVRKQFAILQEAQYLAEEEGDEAAMTVRKVGKGNM